MHAFIGVVLMRTWLQRVELQRFGTVVFGFGDVGMLAKPCLGKIRWSNVVVTVVVEG